MENKSANCSDKKIDIDQDSTTCKSMVHSPINELYVTASSLADGFAYLDKEMTKPVRIEIDSRLTHKSE